MYRESILWYVYWRILKLVVCECNFTCMYMCANIGGHARNTEIERQGKAPSVAYDDAHTHKCDSVCVCV